MKMKRYFVITGTVTYAIKGRDALRHMGFKAYLHRTSNTHAGVGCGYGVVTECDPQNIERIFKKYGIRYLEITEEE